MFLIFCLARLNVLPVGDLGFKNAVKKNYKLKKFPSEKKIEVISKKYSWHPYRSVAAWYHWLSLSLKSE
jgi:DNA-3-methyladenine glycosylase II